MNFAAESDLKPSILPVTPGRIEINNAQKAFALASAQRALVEVTPSIRTVQKKSAVMAESPLA